jgi:hypothetical protein
MPGDQPTPGTGLLTLPNSCSIIAWELRNRPGANG